LSPRGDSAASRRSYTTRMRGMLLGAVRQRLPRPLRANDRVVLLGTADPRHTLTRSARAFSEAESSRSGFRMVWLQCVRRWNRIQPSVIVGFGSRSGGPRRLSALAGSTSARCRPLGDRLAVARCESGRSSSVESRSIRLIATTEGGVIALECIAHEGLHINEHLVLVEDCDGKLLLTNLTNRAQPFIRYELAEKATWLCGRCGCGAESPRLQLLDGRETSWFDLPGPHGSRGGSPDRISVSA